MPRPGISGGRAEIGFELSIRVYFQDTDAGGVVYHGAYLDYLERARTEWLRGLGFDQRELTRRFGVLFIVRTLRIAYARPALLDDALTVTADIDRLGRAQVTLAQQVRRGAETLASAGVNLACVTSVGLRPSALPAPVYDALAADAEQEMTRHAAAVVSESG